MQPMQPMQPLQPMEQDSSNKVWYLIGAAVIIALGLWYFYGVKAPTADTGTSAVTEVQIPELTGGNTTADISADLSQIPDTSAALDADAAASASAIGDL